MYWRNDMKFTNKEIDKMRWLNILAISTILFYIGIIIVMNYFPTTYLHHYINTLPIGGFSAISFIVTVIYLIELGLRFIITENKKIFIFNLWNLFDLLLIVLSFYHYIYGTRFNEIIFLRTVRLFDILDIAVLTNFKRMVTRNLKHLGLAFTMFAVLYFTSSWVARNYVMPYSNNFMT